jgi:hypothetical protein
MLISNEDYAQRYLNEVFTGVTVTSNIVYANNVTLNGNPQDLYVDIYEPDTALGDSLTERPLIIWAHTGSFLGAPGALQCNGSKTDSTVVEVCTRFAKMGYVAAAVDYRVGWNPFDPSQTERIRGLLNAAYRGIQDIRTCTRWFRKDVDSSGNTYGVDTSKIIIIGQGTGGYISFSCATLDRFDGEMNLPQFIDPSCPDPFNMLCSVIDTALSGDMYGLGMGTPIRPLNIENHPGYSSEIHMAINLGGALPDTSWLESGDVPMVGLHNSQDAFAPYASDWVIVPLTGELVVIVSGTHDALEKANRLGNNDILCRDWTDPFSARAATALVSHKDHTNPHTEGIEGLFPIVLQTASSQTWDWWDPTDPPNCVTNDPTLNRATGMAYIDTVMGFITPRMVCALNLLGVNSCPSATTCPTGPVDGIDDKLMSQTFKVYPNPASVALIVSNNIASKPITSVEVFDLMGRKTYSEENLSTHNHTITRNGLADGLYLINIRTEDGLVVKKLILE